ncbi:MAG: ImmA/IrrE family metallo-endopeptidase [Candidatus Accumulibacter sp.]|jgi:Zn-dependent peptidase ImmA (M78 family)|nr:ImmA/IrrE family metallo-endopeptidase [Accumulibacter sp.]
MNSHTVTIKPELLTWARERAGLDAFALAGRFPKLAEWEGGELQPTLRQLENFAHAVHVPIGYLFLPQPIEESLPIPDFRTLADRTITRPGPNVLDTLYLCQQRQDWYRDYARMTALPELDFIGSVTTGNDSVMVADAMRTKLHLSTEERQQLPNWSEALRHFIAKVEEAGVLVMASSIVGSNSHRKLDVGEFRGFALADNLAPLVFLNAADSKAAQMFTLAHELAHLWLGKSGISDTETGRLPDQDIERWCNAVAAELLIPMSLIREAYQPDLPVPEEIQRLARQFKVSTLVALRRLFDADFINETSLWQNYRKEVERIRALNRETSGGGNFYRTLSARTGKRFARAVLASTLEGQTLFQDAFRMLGVKKSATFYNAARELEVML